MLSVWKSHNFMQEVSFHMHSHLTHLERNLCVHMSAIGVWQDCTRANNKFVPKSAKSAWKQKADPMKFDILIWSWWSRILVKNFICTLPQCKRLSDLSPHFHTSVKILKRAFWMPNSQLCSCQRNCSSQVWLSIQVKNIPDVWNRRLSV